MTNTVSESEKFQQLSKFIDEMHDEKGVLMPVMQKAQEIFGHLPMKVQEFIADSLGIPLSKVYGVATFYAQFAIEPKGEHVIGVCMGTACYVKGSEAILNKIKEELNVEAGKTTVDNKFTLDATRCLGCCGLAPVMMIGDQVFGRLKPESIPDILAKF